HVSMYDLRGAVAESGNRLFDRDTLRFLRWRIGSYLYGGRLFVTSEQAGDNSSRRYTIRMVRQYLDRTQLDVATVGGVQRFDSHAEDHKAARLLGRQLRRGAIRPCDIDDDVNNGYLAVSEYREND